MTSSSRPTVAEQIEAVKQIGRSKRSKYGNRKTVVDGITFDSAWEAECWGNLKLRERAGEITNLQRQTPIPLLTSLNGHPAFVRFENKHEAKLIVDFSWHDSRGNLVLGDAKGFVTDVATLKLAIVRSAGYRVEIFQRRPSRSKAKRSFSPVRRTTHPNIGSAA